MSPSSPEKRESVAGLGRAASSVELLDGGHSEAGGRARAGEARPAGGWWRCVRILMDLT